MIEASGLETSEKAEVGLHGKRELAGRREINRQINQALRTGQVDLQCVVCTFYAMELYVLRSGVSVRDPQGLGSNDYHRKLNACYGRALE